MGFRRLLLTACVSAGLAAAENAPAAGDPFAGYRQAIDSRLSAILERNQEAPQLPETWRVENAKAPGESREVEIEAFAGRFWGGREREFVAALRRFERLRPHLEPILGAEGVPAELAAVALIESGAQPLAISPRGARGLWQLIPGTARQYGLAVNGANDERIELVSATRAAARYLHYLYNRFGNWPLALAAYNAGPKAVESALDRRRMSTFWQLSAAGLLPAETRSYVPAVLAAMRLLGSAAPGAPAEEESGQSDRRVYASVGATARTVASASNEPSPD